MEKELEQLESLSAEILDYLKHNSGNIIWAVVILVVGFLAAGRIAKLVNRVCLRKDLDVTLSRFFTSSTRVLVIILFTIVSVNKIGIEITPFIALLGASAFGLSLAVQGPISNFGAGIVLIITRPFKVGDTLSIHQCTGIVTYIKLGTTQLETEDGEEITIPNRKMLGEILTNSFHLMVVEGVVGVEYASDPEAAIQAVQSALAETEDISPERPPQVGIQAFGDSAIEIGYRYWIPTANYYRIQYAANLRIFNALAAAGIKIPFPQRDVRIVNGEP